MRKNMILVLALFLCFGILLAACSGPAPIEPTPSPQPTLTVTPAPTPAETPEPEPTPTPDPTPTAMPTPEATPHLVWLVPPTLEFNHVVYCAHCNAFVLGDHLGRVINRETGALTDDILFGHGLEQLWIFDSARNLLGTTHLGDLTLFPFIEDLYWLTGLIVVAQVDSSLREGNSDMEWLAPEAFTGRYAVMYNGRFVTDFVFDAREQVGEHAFFHAVALGQDGLWGLIGRAGAVVLPFVFEHVAHDDRVAFVKVDGRYGILDLGHMR
ncbi:MAG: hypothetical protein FWE12_00770 [Oscillospiraceae bacterium]|nr:hypothetical protein [Oscillospiraceae bacterium]